MRRGEAWSRPIEAEDSLGGRGVAEVAIAGERGRAGRAGAVRPPVPGRGGDHRPGGFGQHVRTSARQVRGRVSVSVLVKVRTGTTGQLHDVLRRLYEIEGVSGIRATVALETFFERPVRPAVVTETG